MCDSSQDLENIKFLKIEWFAFYFVPFCTVWVVFFFFNQMYVLCVCVFKYRTIKR